MKKCFKMVSFILLFVCMFLLVGCGKETTTKTNPTTTISPTTETKEEVKRVISGVVSSYGEKISGAKVVIRNTNYETTTDEAGLFSFTIQEKETEIAEFRLIITKDGFVQTTKDVLKTDFADSKAEVAISLETTGIELNGKVSSKDGVLSGVKVSISGTETSVITKEDGNYSFNIERPVGVTLVFSKDYFDEKELVLSELSTGKTFTNDIVLDELLLDVTGEVYNNYSGVIEGATISIEGTDYKTTSDASGKYNFKDLKLASKNYTILVSKDGFLEAKYSSKSAEKLELVKNYSSLGAISGPTDIGAYLTKSSTGFYFRFVLDKFRYESGKEEKIQVYINPGKYTESTRLGEGGAHAIEVALTSNNGICVFVNYLGGVSYVSSILWGQELIYTSNVVDGKTVLDLYIKYSVFGDYCGVDFAIDDKSIVGLNLAFYSAIEEKNLFTWNREDMLGVSETAVVYHDNPQDWIRVSSDGQSLYEASDNLEHEKIERTINGVVTDGTSPIEGATVAIPELNLTTKTDTDGRYSFTIPVSKYAVTIFRLTVIKDGYLGGSKTILDKDFKDHVGTLADIVLEKSLNYISVSGKVVNKDGVALSGVKVDISGTEFSTLTDKDGNFAFEKVDHSIPYTLLFSLDGYVSSSFEINKEELVLTESVVLKAVIPAPIVAITLDVPCIDQYLGTVGDDMMKVYLSYDGAGILTMKYVYTNDAFTGSPFEERVDLSLTFKGEKNVYDIRFVANGWTGIWNATTSAWETWNDKIPGPKFVKGEKETTATQTINLVFFSDLEEDISEIKLTVSELTSTSYSALVYNDKNQTNVMDKKTWINLIPQLDLSSGNAVNLGSFGVDNVKGSLAYKDNIFTITYTIDENFTASPEEWLHFGFQAGTSDIYLIRAINGTWTGIFDVTTNTWAPWTADVANPVINTVEGVTTITQTIKTSYFTDTLKITLEDFHICLFESASEDSNKVEGSMTYNGVSFISTDASNWPTVILSTK